MGRNAKLRQQHKQESLSNDKPKAISKKEKAAQRTFFEQMTSWFRRAPSVKEEPVEFQALEFSKKNNVKMGAIAWEGYQKSGKGLVLIQESEESDAAIEYVSRKTLKKALDKYSVEQADRKAIASMIETCEPEENLVMVYVSKAGEMTATITPKLAPTPPECARLHKEKI